jgi:hypothetical protein
MGPDEQGASSAAGTEAKDAKLLRAPHDKLDAAAREIVAAAEQRGLPLRTIGGVAVWQGLPEPVRDAYVAARPAPRDIDLLGPSKSSASLTAVFAGLRYDADERLIAWRGDRRHRYFREPQDGAAGLEVDVFVGVPPLCHELDFRQRLGFPGPAIAPSDLTLLKLQIVEVNQKDLIDLCFMFLSHEPRSEDTSDAFDATRVIAPMSDDWGLHYTSTRNLAQARAIASDVLGAEQAALVVERIDALQRRIDEAPKSRRWKLRARVGTRVQWYTEVEEVDR